MTTDVARRVAAIWRIEGARVVATLARVAGDLATAEDLAQDAVAEAPRVAPSPVVELDRAVAVSMASGPLDALAIVDGLAAAGVLRGSLLPSVTGPRRTPAPPRGRVRPRGPRRARCAR